MTERKQTMTVYKIVNTDNGDISFAYTRNELRLMLNTTHPTIHRLFQSFKGGKKIGLCLDHVIEQVEVDQEKFKEAVEKSLMGGKGV